MAKFTSRYDRFGFYVNGQLKQFFAGQYATEDKAEIEVLSAMSEVERVDEPAKAEVKKAEEKPAKAPAKTSEK
jgi:hypothetical protein